MVRRFEFTDEEYSRIAPLLPDMTPQRGGRWRDHPIYHHKHASIEAHLTIVFAALAVSRWIEDRTGWSIKKFVRTARRYRTIQIQSGEHTLTAAPLPDDLRQALKTIHAPSGAH